MLPSGRYESGDIMGGNMTRTCARISTLACVAGLCGQAFAEPLPTTHYLPLTVAIEAANAALEECTKAGHHVSVTVMNANALVLVQYHHEHASLHSTFSSHGKAYTVLSQSYASGETTSTDVVKRVMANPTGVARVSSIPNFVLSPGGTLIKFGKETVGSIGVGGSSGGENDQKCANFAVEKIRPHLTP